MAIVTHCDRAVTALEPRVEMPVHDVAIRTGRRVVGHVGIALCVDEGESPDAYKEAEKDGEDQGVSVRHNVNPVMASGSTLNSTREEPGNKVMLAGQRCKYLFPIFAVLKECYNTRKGTSE